MRAPPPHLRGERAVETVSGSDLDMTLTPSCQGHDLANAA